MKMRAVLGGFALAFTPGFNVANVGAVADQALHDGAVRHARGAAGADGPVL